MAERVINVHDRRHHWLGSWEVEEQTLDMNTLNDGDVGRTVIWCGHPGRPEAGTVSSWKLGLVFVRFTQGDTAAACKPGELRFAIRPCDGKGNR